MRDIEIHDEDLDHVEMPVDKVNKAAQVEDSHSEKA